MAGVSTLRADSTQLDLGYRQMYNLQFDDAHRTFQEWDRQHPEDPMGPVSQAAAYLFAEFDRLKILQSEFFSNDRKFLDGRSATPDPALKAKFDSALEQARQRARAKLARNPQDADATFAEILRLGLHSDYLALIERRYVPSLQETKTSRAMAEQLLARNPEYSDAYLAIGVENYLLSLKSAPVRWMLRLGGAQTDQKAGIAKLQITAKRGRLLRPFAKLLLAVAAIRAKDRHGAREQLTELAADFPQNPLYREELARLE
jgi:hypothetical protein